MALPRDVAAMIIVAAASVIAAANWSRPTTEGVVVAPAATAGYLVERDASDERGDQAQAESVRSATSITTTAAPPSPSVAPKPLPMGHNQSEDPPTRNEPARDAADDSNSRETVQPAPDTIVRASTAIDVLRHARPVAESLTADGSTAESLPSRETTTAMVDAPTISAEAARRRRESVEVFQPGAPRSEVELKKEHAEIASFEERLNDRKFTLLVDLSALSRDDLARVCTGFRLRTSNREIFLDSRGTRIDQLEPVANQLVGERPGRIPAAVAVAADAHLGQYHNARVVCFFTDQTAAVLYRAVARLSARQPLPPEARITLQLRPSTDGRMQAVAIGGQPITSTTRRP